MKKIIVFVFTSSLMICLFGQISVSAKNIKVDFSGDSDDVTMCVLGEDDYYILQVMMKETLHN